MRLSYKYTLNVGILMRKNKVNEIIQFYQRIFEIQTLKHRLYDLFLIFKHKK